MMKNHLTYYPVSVAVRSLIKPLIFLFLSVFLGSCSQTVLINSTTKNPPGNDTPLDKKSGIVLSASNDSKGILINIRIPDTYDQYKVLKYGALLSIKTDKGNQTYSVAYPLENTDKSLRLPIAKKNDSSFNVDNLLSGLAGEAKQLAAFQFYGKKNYTGNSGIQDSLALQAVKETGNPVLIYTAYIPYNSIPDFKKSKNAVNKIKIHFQSAFLNVIGGQGLSSSSGPFYAGYASYFGPYYNSWRGSWNAGYSGYWSAAICRPWLGYISTVYNPHSERYKRKHPNTPVPDTKVLERLTIPIDVEANIQLAR